MIQVFQCRTKDGGHHTQPSFGKSIERALIHLVVYELGYGGMVTDITETSVSVSTKIMGCLDKVTFKGTAEEMKALRMVAAAHAGSWLTAQDEMIEATVKTLNRTLGDKAGSPMLLTMCAGFAQGAVSTPVALAMAFGLGEADTKLVVEHWGGMFDAKSKREDLIAALFLSQETNTMLGDILA